MLHYWTKEEALNSLGYKDENEFIVHLIILYSSKFANAHAWLKAHDFREYMMLQTAFFKQKEEDAVEWAEESAETDF